MPLGSAAFKQEYKTSEDRTPDLSLSKDLGIEGPTEVPLEGEASLASRGVGGVVRAEMAKDFCRALGVKPDEQISLAELHTIVADAATLGVEELRQRVKQKLEQHMSASEDSLQDPHTQVSFSALLDFVDVAEPGLISESSLKAAIQRYELRQRWSKTWDEQCKAVNLQPGSSREEVARERSMQWMLQDVMSDAFQGEIISAIEGCKKSFDVCVISRSDLSHKISRDGETALVKVAAPPSWKNLWGRLSRTKEGPLEDAMDSPAFKALITSIRDQGLTPVLRADNPLDRLLFHERPYTLEARLP